MAAAVLLILLLTALGWWLSRSTAWGRQLGMTMVVLLLGLVVTNITGWQPSKAAAGWVSGPLTSLAIAQLLLAVDLRRVWPDARRLLTPFVASVLLTLVAVLLGGLVIGPWLGAERSVLAGVFTATFTGGSLNFVSVARTLQPPESLLLVATAADHVVFAIWFAVNKKGDCLFLFNFPCERNASFLKGNPIDGKNRSSRPCILSLSANPVFGAAGTFLLLNLIFRRNDFFRINRTEFS